MLRSYDIRQRRRLFTPSIATDPAPPPAPADLLEIAPEPIGDPLIMSATPAPSTPRTPRPKSKASETQLEAILGGLPSGKVIAPIGNNKPYTRPVSPHSDITPHQRVSANLLAYDQQEINTATRHTWTEEIEIMRAFFAAHPPANNTRLDAATMIEDAALFIATNLETVARYDGNRYFEPAMNRLRKLINLVNHNIDITPGANEN